MGAASPGRIVVDVGALSADAMSLDALARLQLTARRVGLDTRLRNASAELLDLIAFAGLAAVLRVEARREPEEREQRLRVEEERELDDPPTL
jgi:hypothetical protein